MKSDDDKKLEKFESFLKQNKPLAPPISPAEKSALFGHVLETAIQKKPSKAKPSVFMDLAKRPAVSIAASFIIVFGVILFASYSDMELDLFQSPQNQSLSSAETVNDTQGVESFLVQSFEPWEDDSEFAVEPVEFESDYVAYFLE